MADNVTITAGTGTTIATEGTTINAVPVQVQQVKQVLGGRDAYTGSQGGRLVDGTTDTAAAYSDPRVLAATIVVTPVITASSAYASGQCLGPLMSFASAARVSGGSLMVMSVNIVDADKQNAAIELVLFGAAPTATTDKTTFAPSKADLQKVVGIIPIGYYSTYSANAVAAVNNAGLEVVLNSTSTLTGQLVLRGTPTYTTTTSIVVTLTVLQD